MLRHLCMTSQSYKRKRNLKLELFVLSVTLVMGDFVRVLTPNSFVLPGTCSVSSTSFPAIFVLIAEEYYENIVGCLQDMVKL